MNLYEFILYAKLSETQARLLFAFLDTTLHLDAGSYFTVLEEGNELNGYDKALSQGQAKKL